ncbi:hypothetical protein F4780DRAFT_776985 [Xylariomycetidae sp. FL0641]|nr:hypothetical protein F4780DRAFT_776985 [Xylariomycetidae sp. FL0641]
MSSESQQQLPLTPWAQRFTSKWQTRITNDLFPGQKGIRSGLAPFDPFEGPSFHPKFYLDIPGKFRQPSQDPRLKGLQEVAEEFFNDGHQQAAKGFPTWQLTTMNSLLNFTGSQQPISGGHRSRDGAKGLADIEGVLEVDESKWYPFFRKSRWLDYKADLPAPINERDDYSVDDAQLWDKLRLSIELADRILKLLVQEGQEFLETLLFAPLDDWVAWRPKDAGARLWSQHVLIPESRKAQRLRRPKRSWPAEQWEDRLSRLLTHHFWSFLRGGHGLNGMTSFTWQRKRALRVTDMDHGGPAFGPSPQEQMTLGTLHCLFMDGLMNQDATIAELSASHVVVAKTILHELMHAIGCHRTPEWARDAEVDPNSLLEPPYNFEPIAEAGASFEQKVFGGTIQADPLWHDKGPFVLFRNEWPSLATATASRMDPTAFGPEAPFRRSIVPTLWASRLLSSAFWQQSPLSSQDLRAPEFASTTVSPYGSPSAQLNRAALRRDAQLAPLLRTWERRVGLLYGEPHITTLDAERGRWKGTPWGNPFEMECLWRFRQEWDDGELLACADIADTLMLSTNDPARKWPNPREPLKCEWLFWAVSLLMCAALPLRLEAQRLRRGDYDCHHTASAAMRQASGAPRALVNLIPALKPEIVVGPSLLLDDDGPLNPPVQRMVDVPDQAAYLHRVRWALGAAAEATYKWDIAVSRPWVVAIETAMDAIEVQRRSCGADQATQSWPFTVPAYDPDSRIRAREDKTWYDV